MMMIGIGTPRSQSKSAPMAFLPFVERSLNSRLADLFPKDRLAVRRDPVERF
jgi:hypothetical protein